MQHGAEPQNVEEPISNTEGISFSGHHHVDTGLAAPLLPLRRERSVGDEVVYCVDFYDLEEQGGVVELGVICQHESLPRIGQDVLGGQGAFVVHRLKTELEVEAVAPLEGFVAPELVGAMTGRLDEMEVLARSRAVEAEAVEIDPEMEERLRNLGY